MNCTESVGFIIEGVHGQECYLLDRCWCGEFDTLVHSSHLKTGCFGYQYSDVAMVATMRMTYLCVGVSIHWTGLLD